MLATMRPVQASISTPSHLPQSQHSSRPSSRTSSTPSNSAKQTRASTMNSKTATAARAKKETPVVQSTPGLLTLSRPLDSFKDSSDDGSTGRSGARQGKKKKASVAPAAAAEGAVTRSRQRKQKESALAIDALKAEDDFSLSRSAPSASTDAPLQFDMPTHNNNKANAAATPAMTWQQELLNSQGPPPKKPTGKGDKSASTSGQQKAVANGKAAGKALTWQQELLGSNKPRGPTFDVFADERDAQTFGGAGDAPGRASAVTSGKSKKKAGTGRPRAGSAGQYDLSMQANGPPRGNKKAGAALSHNAGSNGFPTSSSSSGPPSTPNKLAYAGPNFHNSPSPASLPVPKFLQSKSAELSSSSSGAANNPSLFAREAQQQHSDNYREADSSTSSSGSSDVEDESFSGPTGQHYRSARGVTAPPDLQSGGSSATAYQDPARNVTIENLLAKMMRPGSDF